MNFGRCGRGYIPGVAHRKFVLEKAVKKGGILCCLIQYAAPLTRSLEFISLACKRPDFMA